MANKVKYLIVGAGPTGLGAAYRLQELGCRDYLVVDSASQVGGLAASFKDEQGFVWDIGGHVQFSHYKYFDDLMHKALGADGWFKLERESWVWMRDSFIPYPFQNNIRHLPKEDLWKCIQGLVEIYKHPEKKAPADFRQWILQTFGQGLADVFMLPYNFKVWAFPAEQMSFQWIGERVAVTDLQKILENMLFAKDDLSWGPNNTFQFPKEGGTGAIWESVATLSGRERISLRNGVKEIQPAKKKAILQDGTEVQYEHCLSTIPLDSLVKLSSGSPAPVLEAAAGLKFSSSNIVGVGLDGEPPEELRKKCWMYFPEDDCPFYRVTVFSNYSRNNVPKPGKQWSLMAEVSESSAKPVDAGKLIEDVIQGLRNTKLLPEGTKVLSQWSFRAFHGYPTPFLGRDPILQKLQGYFQPLEIYPRGRFGGWKYEVSNQDHSMMQGVEWVNRMLLQVPETTFFFPGTANANWGK
jgi:protoporphyrinogen oxidase